MAGNKSKRKSAGTRRTMSQTPRVVLPVIELPPPPGELKRAAKVAQDNFDFLLKGEADKDNWFSVLKRLYVGFFAYETYFDPPDSYFNGQDANDVEDAFCAAINYMRVAVAEYDATGKFIFGEHELTLIQDALDMTTAVVRDLTLTENSSVHRYVLKRYFIEIEIENEMANQVYQKRCQEMAATLQQERTEVEEIAA